MGDFFLYNAVPFSGLYRVFIIRIIGVLLLSGPSTAFRWRSTSLGMTKERAGGSYPPLHGREPAMMGAGTEKAAVVQGVTP